MMLLALFNSGAGPETKEEIIKFLGGTDFKQVSQHLNLNTLNICSILDLGEIALLWAEQSHETYGQNVVMNQLLWETHIHKAINLILSSSSH